MIEKDKEWSHTQKVAMMMMWYGLGGMLMFFDINVQSGLYLWSGLVYFTLLLGIAHYIKS